MPHRQRLDARIFDQIDQRNLQRLERTDREQAMAQHQMRLGVRRRGAEQRTRGITLDAAIDLRQPNQRPRDRGAALCHLVVVRKETAQEGRAPPQCGEKRLQLDLDFRKADAAEIARDHAAGKLILEREERDATRLVAGCRPQPSRDKVLEGIDGAGASISLSRTATSSTDSAACRARRSMTRHQRASAGPRPKARAATGKACSADVAARAPAWRQISAAICAAAKSGAISSRTASFLLASQ